MNITRLLERDSLVLPALPEHEVRISPGRLRSLAHLHLEGVVVLALVSVT